MSIKRGIESLSGFNNITGTPSDFKMFYKYGLNGLTDIDQAYERYGEFIFAEGKNVMGDSYDLPIGQFIFLDKLQAKLGDISTVLLVGYKSVQGKKLYWISTINQFKRFCSDKEKETHYGYTIKMKSANLGSMKGPCSEEQYCKFMKKLCDELE